MNDDIVTRLRHDECCGAHIENDDSYGCTPCQAADEIESLRASVKDLKEALERMLKRNAHSVMNDDGNGGSTEAALRAWQKVAHLFYEKANPTGASICDCTTCREYKYLAEGNIKMDSKEVIRPEYQYVWDREEYWVVKANSDGSLYKSGGAFASKEEASRYVEWRNAEEVGQ